MTDEELLEAMKEALRASRAYTPQMELLHRINASVKGQPLADPINWKGIK